MSSVLVLAAWFAFLYAGILTVAWAEKPRNPSESHKNTPRSAFQRSSDL